MDKKTREMFIEMLVDYIRDGSESIALGDLDYFFPDEIDEAYEIVRFEQLASEPDPMLDPQLG